MHSVVVIGLGSMGRRRIRLLKTLAEPLRIVGIDLSAARRQQAHAEMGIETVADLETAVRLFAPDVALVCASPLSHGPLVLDCLNRGLHVFMEINLTHTWYAQAENLAREKGLQAFVSSTFLYHPQLANIADAVRGMKVNYIYHSGQYLPDWHPWEDYRNFFVADKRTNACREILAIEFPWILNAFGDVESVHVMKDKSSSLNLDFPDNYIISLRHRNGSKGVFCLDVISRKSMRALEVYSEDLHLFWDGRLGHLARYDIARKEMCTIESVLTEDWDPVLTPGLLGQAYREELVNFFACVAGQATPRHSLGADRRVLDLIDDIESGMEGKEK